MSERIAFHPHATRARLSDRKERHLALGCPLIAAPMALTSLHYWPPAIMAEHELLHYPIAIGVIYVIVAAALCALAIRMVSPSRRVLGVVSALVVAAAGVVILARTFVVAGGQG